MKYLIIVLLIIIIFPYVYAEEKEEVLADVNGVKITMADFENEVNSLPEQYRGKINKKKFLDDLILQELLYEEAKKKKLQEDKDVIDALKMVEKKILVQKLVEKEVMQLAKPTEEEIKKYYEENKDNYKIPEQVNAAHILIRVKDGATEEEDNTARKKLEDILKKIKEGGDFATLAKENSDCPSKSRGGELGYFSRGQMVPEFEEVAFKLKPGEISEIVKTKFGYHIIKVLDKKEPRQKELSEVKEEIEQQLTRKKQKDAFENYTKGLKEKAKITINEELLK